MPEEHQPVVDWRGTPINVGDTVIYASPKGRSCSFVEGTVKSFGPANIVVYPVRESFGYTRTNPTVNVRPDRVTVVGELPPTSMETVLEKKVNAERRMLNLYVEEKERRAQSLPPTSSWLASHSDEDVQSRIDGYQRSLDKLVGEQPG
jgi:hypothetical protein